MKMTITKTLEFTEGEIKIIKTLMETPQYEGGSKGWWEFRGTSRGMCRGGILNGDDAWSLLAKGALTDDEDAWHTTFKITDFGKEVYEQIKVYETE